MGAAGSLFFYQLYRISEYCMVKVNSRGSRYL